ncbi:PAS domain S-box protein [Devosia sp. J2-20]|uniref:Sensor protein FixL n=1 Tax=Devosia litorisediminis TaxID=2829817 RepID=A0A942E3M2_9HYPH|nr:MULTISPECIES: PAS domain S-box protein [Devosia]MBS3847603.1 PAS domain S-box protein [Devosia litorisediminis]WDQ99276.1 PAS domain S-box protein [Devosia sp. J2-20]
MQQNATHKATGARPARWSIGPKFISLKNKIIALTCVTALLSAVVVGGVGYYRIEKIVLDTAVQKLAGETRLMAQRFKFSYDQMKSDAQVLSQTPPIKGILRSVDNDGLDPLDGSTQEAWSARLGSIFASMMAARPHYVQLRYIGVADFGRELVRVNRLPAGLEYVKAPDLQQKAMEPYFIAGVQTPSKTVHFSEVSYNRERGSLDVSLVPTVRTVLPVFGPEGAVFGMIVINANYAEMLRPALLEIAPQDNTFVVNSAGDYLEHKKDGTIGKFEFHDAYSVSPPSFITEISQTNANEKLFTTDNAVSYFVRLNIDPQNPEAFLGVVSRVPYDELMAAAIDTRTVSLVSGALLILGCLVASLVVARWFTEPLKRMTAEIKHSAGHHTLENLPLDRGDEIGDLARAFDQKARDLATNEAKLTAIVDNTVDGLITIDARGHVETFNRACEDIFGYEAEEVIGRNVKMLMPAPYHDEHDGYLKNYHGTGERKVIGIGREVEGRRKDGSIFPLDLSVSQVNIGDRTIYSGIVRDISERKQMERMKDEFISTVNHELRTPLTSIQGSLGLLMAMPGKATDERTRKLLQLSYDNCQRLSRLVNDILDMEKIAAGKLEYQLEVVEVCQLVADIVERQQSFAEKHDVSFAVDFAVPKVFVNLDQDRFDQALVNLLSNAAKFSAPGDSVEIGVAMDAAANVIISVRDYGPGIPEAFRSKIFGKFAQADGSASRVNEGSGLGLNITKKIIEAFDGVVEYQTEEGVGTVFTFVLPACPPQKMRA